MSKAPEMEVWKNIKGFEHYQVSRNGRIKSLRLGRMLKPSINHGGYLYVRLNGSRHKKVHRIVAEAFIPNPYLKPTVNHRDGNKQNNSVENLEWATYSENLFHAHKTGLNPGKRKKVKCFETGEVYQSTLEAQRKTGINNGSISRCARGLINMAGGFSWAYL